MAAAKNQPLMGNRGPAFELSPGIAIQDEQHVLILINDIGCESGGVLSFKTVQIMEL